MMGGYPEQQHSQIMRTRSAPKLLYHDVVESMSPMDQQERDLRLLSEERMGGG
eukprot:CAMPEP_0185766670 /NCGR_PEP_ID=MMETSP1174-20130828/38575_1 /TAXON_ID=35687 /ORGANISM="Dictyocha speculum, Strain CCMP1381" /LENGTH=52 /DNA_ID=CAMNT_0028450457 /DNA_START=42 /DNA_END=196 /DNA_ORIENTATION=+